MLTHKDYQDSCCLQTPKVKCHEILSFKQQTQRSGAVVAFMESRREQKISIKY